MKVLCKAVGANPAVTDQNNFIPSAIAHNWVLLAL